MGDRENIQVKDPNFATDGDYYYCLLNTSKILQVKSDDGTVAFSYPCDTSTTNTINSLDFDGVYFWSLENRSGGGLIIRKWAIDSFILKQINSFTMLNTSIHTYSSNDMAVEHYCLSVGDNDNGGSGYTMGMDTIKISDTSMLSPGDVLTFSHRRAPTQNKYSSTYVEQVTVNQVLDGTTIEITKVGGMTGDPYGDGKGFRGPAASHIVTDPTPPDFVYVTKNIWLLNDNSPSSTGVPSIYKISSVNGSFIVSYSGSQYSGVKGATFYTKYTTLGTFPYKYNTVIYNNERFVLFVRGSNVIFFNIATAAVEKSISITNLVKTDSVTYWDVYEMAVSGFEPDISLFRLQGGTTYGSPLADEAWSGSYSYEKTLLRKVVNSIAVTASPTILPADGASTSNLMAYVTDQYGGAVVSKVVNWADDSGGSRVSPPASTTDAFGRAVATYTSGDTEDDVKITATVANGLV
jgi:hypothetical protein